MKINVNASQPDLPFPHFWRSTGFTPARLFRRVDMRQQIDYFGMIPFDGVTYVRIHYMLDLVCGSGFYGDNPDIDWSGLDELLDALTSNRLKPFFELMGGPFGYFDNFELDEQAQGWRRFCRLLAQHCVERYGQDEVRSWYFETWNEPDHAWWKQSDLAFHRYWDACANGIKDADPALRFGGPGTATYMSERLLSILKHLDSGKDYFTGERPKVDFISVHEKGSHGHQEDISPDMRAVVEREVALAVLIQEQYPNLVGVPLMNNECDPQVGWKDIHSWRGRPYYAALIIRTIRDHHQRLVRELGLNYELLSNDNGFTGTWGQRTHVARFGSDSCLEAGYVEQIKKPAHHAMTLLAFLGEELVEVDSDPAMELYGRIGVIATRRGEDQVAVLIDHGCDQPDRSGSERIELKVSGLGFREGSIVHYRIDHDHTNPMRIWEQKRGFEIDLPGPPHAVRVGPQHRELIDMMRAGQELDCIDGPRTFAEQSDAVELSFDLPMPGVSLLLFSRKPEETPAAPGKLAARRYWGLTGRPQVMLRWDDCGSRVVKSYEVFFEPAEGGPGRRVNDADLVCRGYLHVADDIRGSYRVRAVDHWGRSGPFSEVVKV